MKVEVTSLKTSGGWPDGTKVGDIVDLPGDAVPAWAAGKCRPAPADAAEAAAETVAKAPKGKK